MVKALLLWLALLQTTPPDMHLKTGSPAIGKAVCLAAVTKDADGVSRPNRLTNTQFLGDTGCDIGAYQFTNGISVVLLAPTGLTATCGNGTVTVRWNPVAGALTYDLGIDYPPNNSAPNAEDGWFVPGSTDARNPALVATTFTTNIVTGQLYQWWVGGNGLNGPGPWVGSSFTCNGASPPPDTASPTIVIKAP